MADEIEPTEEQAARPEIDWKAEFEKVSAQLEEARKQSRKWEDRSKSNADKAKRYDELAAQSMTDAERIDAESKRADEAEAKLAAYEAEAQRAKDAAEVSEKFGIPASLLTETERKAMELQAQAIKAFAEGQPSAQVFKADGSKPEGSPNTPQQAFHEFFQSIQR